jgi:hypothetical protein
MPSAISAATARKHPEVNLGWTDRVVARLRYAQIARERELQPATEARAVDGCDHWFGAELDRVAQLAQADRKCSGKHTRRARACCILRMQVRIRIPVVLDENAGQAAGEHDDSHLRIAAGGVQRLLQRGQHCGRQKAFRRVHEPDYTNVIIDSLYGDLGHAGLLRFV